MSKHVVSLYLSRQLVEAGIKIDSEFWWVLPGDPEAWDGWKWKDKETEFELTTEDTNIYFDWTYGEKYPAPLATEIAELLPEKIFLKGDGCSRYVKIAPANGIWYCEYEENYIGAKSISQFADTMQDAMCLMLIYLKKEGLI